MTSGAPRPIKATTPRGFSSEMLNAGSAGCIVLDIAASSVPSGKSAVGNGVPAAPLAAMMPAPVSDVAQAAYAPMAQFTPIAPSHGIETPPAAQMSGTVATPACVVFMSWLIICAANPTLVRSMIPAIAVPVAPMT